MADLLSAHPLGPHSARKVSDEMLLNSMPQGSLLQQSEMKRTRQKHDLLETNKRSTSYGLDKPLVGDLGNIPDPSLVARPAPFKGGIYNNGTGGLGIGIGAGSSPQLGMPNGQRQQNSFLPMPAATANGNMGMQPSMSMPFIPQQGFFPQPQPNMAQPQMMPMGMNMGIGMQGYGQPGYGYPQMSMQQMQMMAMQQPYDPMMDPRQRDMIDRWRQSIMP